jgi:hypothetical protein
MDRLYFLFLLLILGGCAVGANAQSKENLQFADHSASGKITEQPDVGRSATPQNIAQDAFAACPVTVAPDSPFTPPAPYSDLSLETYFWFGAAHLWTRLPENGTLSGLPHNPHGYTEKLFWWSEFFSLRDEPEPALVVFGERLDAQAPPLQASGATNASAGDIGDAMMVGVDFPTPGCWRVTGQYKKSELSFVIWIAP